MESTAAGTGRERYSFRGKPSVRLLAAASAAALLGSIILVFWGHRSGGTLLLAAGAGSLVAAVALTGMAFWSNSRLRTVVLLESDGVTVVRGRRSHTLPWTTVEGLSHTGERLEIYDAGHRHKISVTNPQRASDPAFTAMVAAIQERLRLTRR